MFPHRVSQEHVCVAFQMTHSPNSLKGVIYGTTNGTSMGLGKGGY